MPQEQQRTATYARFGCSGQASTHHAALFDREQGSAGSLHPEGQVQVRDEYLGRISIRHRLTAYLREIGGHIGYDIRPSARQHGHATAMLAAALPVARSLGIDPALLTCDDDNIASRKVIEANGGTLEDHRHGKARYWVSTS